MTTVLVRLVAVLVVLVVGGVVVPSTASASCAAGSGPAGSETIFVGTAREERLGFTRFDVTRVLAGPDLAPSIWVLSAQRQSPWSGIGGVSSSIDVSFEPGEAYAVGANDFRTDSCSVAWPDDFRGLGIDRTDGRAPRADGATGVPEPVGSLGDGLAAAGPRGGFDFLAHAFWGVWAGE